MDGADEQASALLQGEADVDVTGSVSVLVGLQEPAPVRSAPVDLELARSRSTSHDMATKPCTGQGSGMVAVDRAQRHAIRITR